MSTGATMDRLAELYAEMRQDLTLYGVARFTKEHRELVASLVLERSHQLSLRSQSTSIKTPIHTIHDKQEEDESTV